MGSEMNESIFHALDAIVEVLSLLLGELVDLIEEDGEFVDALGNFLVEDFQIIDIGVSAEIHIHNGYSIFNSLKISQLTFS